MIHHISLGTNDVPRARRFWDAVTAVMGLRCMQEDGDGALYGAATYLIGINKPEDGKPATVGNGAHVAFGLETRAMVDAFYRAGLDNGGKDDGGRGCGRNTMAIITPASWAIPMAIRSRR